MAIKQLRGIVAKRGYIMEYWIKLHEARNYLTDKKTGTKKPKVRSAVKHPFAYMKEKLNYKKTVAKTEDRNRFIFDMNCILYNIFSANYLLEKVACQ